MRGVILNPLQGISMLPVAGRYEVVMSFQEVAFWMWRVAAISVDASASLNGSAHDFGMPPVSASYSNSVSDVYHCPKSALLLGVPRTEVDQLILRQQFSNQFGFGILVNIFEPFGAGTVNAFQFTLNWGTNAYHLDGYPGDEGWVMSFETSIAIFIPNVDVPVPAIFSTNPQTPSVPFTGSILIEADDPVLGHHYEHDIPFSWGATLYDGSEGSVGATSGNADIYVTPSSYYEWKDGLGNPLYDSDTGAKIEA
jgi:hypothetical protein